jgi:hypothetical protein
MGPESTVVDKSRGSTAFKKELILGDDDKIL